jgi:hypothetical protein
MDYRGTGATFGHTIQNEDIAQAQHRKLRLRR